MFVYLHSPSVNGVFMANKLNTAKGYVDIIDY